MILDNVQLPYPPSVNHFWVSSVFKKNGRTIRGRRRSEKALEFAAATIALLGHRKPFLGAVAVEIDVYFPDNRVRDLDNLAKGILDAIVKAGVISDDSQIVDLRLVNKRQVVKGGAVVLRVWAVD